MKRFFYRIKFIFKIHKSIPFLFDFFISREVRWSTKFLFAAIFIGYIVIPIDIIPDFFLIFGLADDFTIALFLLQQMVKVAPKSLKEKHRLMK